MKPWNFQVRAQADTAEIEVVIYDLIGESFFADGITAEDVIAQLRNRPDAKRINLRLNTGGGVMDEATAIYNLLAERAQNGVEVVAYIDGLAASAGAYLTTVASRVVMPANAFMMIHRARGGRMGNASDMQQSAIALQKYDDVITESFAAASSRRGKAKTKADFAAEMAKGDIYLRADEAIAWGLADEKTAVMKAAACLADGSEFSTETLAALGGEPWLSRPAATRVTAEMGEDCDMPGCGDRIKVVTTPHRPEHTTGTVRQCIDGALGIEFDSAPGAVYQWYVASEVMVTAEAPEPPEPMAAVQAQLTAPPKAELETPSGDQTEPQPEPAAPQPRAPQDPPEKPNMTTKPENNEPNLATPTVARAAGLPSGATEADIVAAITRMRENELQVMAITGAQITAEGIGALRGIKAKAERCDAVESELVQVKAERDQQNFDALLMKGQSNPVKLTPATAKMYADEFTAAKGDGRGAEVVARLKGFIDVAPTIHALSRPAGAQPAVHGSAAAPTTHNSKTYAELKPLERARLAQSEPELFRAMKTEFDAAQASG
jgi:ATP-dependent protease ClpP protease subunit